jgi:hypothetical protein
MVWAVVEEAERTVVLVAVLLEILEPLEVDLV